MKTTEGLRECPVSSLYYTDGEIEAQRSLDSTEILEAFRSRAVIRGSEGGLSGLPLLPGRSKQ